MESLVENDACREACLLIGLNMTCMYNQCYRGMLNWGKAAKFDVPTPHTTVDAHPHSSGVSGGVLKPRSVDQALSRLRPRDTYLDVSLGD